MMITVFKKQKKPFIMYLFCISGFIHAPKSPKGEAFRSQRVGFSPLGELKGRAMGKTSFLRNTNYS